MAEQHSGLTVRDLLDSGLHFGHQTKRWNPKMKPYIFDKRNGIHIVDITQSLELLETALGFVQDTVQAGKKVLFVGTKKQAQEVVKGAAEGAGMFYVTTRWLGGTLTNAVTIRRSVRRMKQIQTMSKNNNGVLSVHKKEAAALRRELDKLEKNLSGIADMNEMPGALFVVDIMREANAVAEARTLGIPVVAIVDTNCDPDPVSYMIPGNDDSIRAIKVITDAVAKVAKNAVDEYARAAAEEHRKAEAERAAARASAEAKGGRVEGGRVDGDRPPRDGGFGGDRRAPRPAQGQSEAEAAKAKARLAEGRKTAAKKAAEAVAARAEAAKAEAPAAAPVEAPVAPVEATPAVEAAPAAEAPAE